MDFNQRYYSYANSQRLAATVLTTTNKVVYQAPPDANIHITQLIVYNHGGGTATLNLHHVIRNETATTANAMYYQYTVASKTPIYVQLEFTLRAGEQLVALANTASSLNIIVYGHPL